MVNISFLQLLAAFGPLCALAHGSPSYQASLDSSSIGLFDDSTAAAEMPETAAVQLCATDAHAYYRQLLDGPPDACPVPIGRDGRRQHRWILRPNQTEASVLDSLANDPADPASWAPWSYQPYCGMNSAYCVFTQAAIPESGLGSLAATNQSVADGAQGLSIITTPEMAASALHPHQFALYPHALDMFREFAALPPAFRVQNMTVPGEHGDEYDLSDLEDDAKAHHPKEGLGAVATRAIQAGEAVMVDRPVLLAHFKPVREDEAASLGSLEDNHGLGTEEAAMRHHMWMTAVDRLPEAVGELVRDLHVLPKYRRDGLFDMKTGQMHPFSQEEAAFASNAVQIDIDGFAMKALYPNAARINHDCRPNLVAHISPVTLTMTFWATRPIQAGEELTVSYMPDPLPSQQRKNYLSRKWQFECQCSLCKGPQNVLEESDKRRTLLSELHAELRESIVKGDMERALTAALDVRSTYIEEGLLETVTMLGVNSKIMDSPFGPPGLATTLGHLFWKAGDKENALRNLRAAVAELRWRSSGWPTIQQVQQMDMLHQILARLEG